jgi:Uma2 family endonuclease
MVSDTKNAIDVDNFAELLARIGNVPPERIGMKPPAGMATEEDVLAARLRPGKRLYELVDGVLVEKTMGTKESLLAGVVLRLLGNYVDTADLGVVLGADGMLRLMPGLVRIPDVSFIPWDRIPNEEIPDDAIAELVPDLAVEVLSKKNTRGEMDRKLRDYFLSGTRLVWMIQPKTQTARVYTSPTDSHRVGKNGSLDGGVVLPGFTLPLSELFARTRRRKSDGP